MADEAQQGAASTRPVLSGAPVDHYQPRRFRKFSKKELMYRLSYADARAWSEAHQVQMSPLPLPEAIERRIRQWFELVDDDGSGQLDASELEFALKASGIPCHSNAIMEIIRLFDFDKDGEIAWREFHHFLSTEVMADKDPLGAEYVLPSGMSLPISSMIGAIRRRKLLSDVEKGGESRDWWVSEGPEFLRHLLESERYEFGAQTASREVLRRILSYKPPPSKAADPDAVEQHRRRIEKLRSILTRDPQQQHQQHQQEHVGSSGDNSRSATVSGDAAAGAAAAAAAAAAPAASTHPRGVPRSERGVRFTAAALEEMAAAAVTTAPLEGSSPGRERSQARLHKLGHSGCDAGGEDGTFLTGLRGMGGLPTVPSGDLLDSSSDSDAGGGDGGADQAAAAAALRDGAAAGSSNCGGVLLPCTYADEMARVEEVLDLHHQRTRTTRPRGAASTVALSSLRAASPRHPVVVPLAAAHAPPLPPSGGVLPAAGGGGGASEAVTPQASAPLQLAGASAASLPQPAAAVTLTTVTAAGAAPAQREPLEPGLPAAAATADPAADASAELAAPVKAASDTARDEDGNGGGSDAGADTEGSANDDADYGLWAADLSLPPPLPGTEPLASPSPSLSPPPRRAVPSLALASLQARSLSMSGPGPYSARLASSARTQVVSTLHNAPASARTDDRPDGATVRGSSLTDSGYSTSGAVFSNVTVGAGAAGVVLRRTSGPRATQQRLAPSPPPLQQQQQQQQSVPPRSPAQAGRAAAAAAAADIRRQAWNVGPSGSAAAGWEQPSPRPQTVDGGERLAPGRLAAADTVQHHQQHNQQQHHQQHLHHVYGGGGGGGALRPHTAAAALGGGRGARAVSAPLAQFGSAVRVLTTTAAASGGLGGAGTPRTPGATPRRQVVSPTTGLPLDRGVEVVPLEWVTAPPPLHSPRAASAVPLRASASAPLAQQSRGALSVPQPQAQASMRSSVESSQRALYQQQQQQQHLRDGAGRSSAVSSAGGSSSVASVAPSSSVAHAPAMPSFPAAAAAGGSSRGRLMRSCLAASLRTPGPPVASTPTAQAGALASPDAGRAGGLRAAPARAGSADSVAPIGGGRGCAGPLLGAHVLTKHASLVAAHNARPRGPAGGASMHSVLHAPASFTVGGASGGRWAAAAPAPQAAAAGGGGATDSGAATGDGASAGEGSEPPTPATTVAAAEGTAAAQEPRASRGGYSGEGSSEEPGVRASGGGGGGAGGGGWPWPWTGGLAPAGAHEPEFAAPSLTVAPARQLPKYVPYRASGRE